MPPPLGWRILSNGIVGTETTLIVKRDLEKEKVMSSSFHTPNTNPAIGLDPNTPYIQ